MFVSFFLNYHKSDWHDIYMVAVLLFNKNNKISPYPSDQSVPISSEWLFLSPERRLPAAPWVRSCFAHPDSPSHSLFSHRGLLMSSCGQRVVPHSHYWTKTSIKKESFLFLALYIETMLRNYFSFLRSHFLPLSNKT